MASTCLPIYLQNNISYTRVLILKHCEVLLGRGLSDSELEASLVDSRQDDYFSTDFLPAMAFGHSYMTYKLELLRNR